MKSIINQIHVDNKTGSIRIEYTDGDISEMSGNNFTV